MNTKRRMFPDSAAADGSATLPLSPDAIATQPLVQDIPF